MVSGTCSVGYGPQKVTVSMWQYAVIAARAVTTARHSSDDITAQADRSYIYNTEPSGGQLAVIRCLEVLA